MGPFRLVVLDYAKKQLNDDEAISVYLDVVRYKQKAFQTTLENFVVGDKHDMLASHFCIYDTSQIYRPKLVLALRSVYQDRAKEHHLELPIEYWIKNTGPEGMAEYQRAKRLKPIIVDCNTWFVDPQYSFKNSGIPLSEIGFYLAALQTLRLGHDHFIGCTNEMYHASRWVAKVGPFKDGILFDHPVLPGKHKMAFVESFYESWLLDCRDRFGHLVREVEDLTPKDLNVPSLVEVMESLGHSYAKPA